MKSIGVVLAWVLAVSSGPVFGGITYEKIWETRSEQGFSGLNEIRNGKTGTTMGIIACEVGHGIVCFRPDGRRLWEVPLSPPVTACPAVADVNGDGREEIVACDGNGGVFLISDKGKVLWRSKTRGVVEAQSSPAIADLDMDQVPEIVVPDLSGTVNCFDVKGNRIWTFTGKGRQMGPVLITDLYDSPGREVFVASHNGHVYALGSQGEWLWDLYHPDECMPSSPPILADVEGDGTPEIYIGGGLNHFFRIDPAKPEIVFDENVALHINTAVCGADIDGDGKEEIVFGNKGGKVFCYDDTGIRWTREFHDTSMSSSPVVLDLDGDGKLEVIFLFKGTKVLDSEGNVLAEISGPTFNTAPLAGDFDGDGNLDVVLAGYGMGSVAGLEYRRWNVPYRKSFLGWETFTGNRAHTGRAPGAVSFTPLRVPKRTRTTETSGAGFSAVEPLKLYSGVNAWRFDIENPDRRRLVFLCSLKAPDGTRQTVACPVRTEKKRIRVDLESTVAGKYEVEPSLLDADRRQILNSKKTVLSYGGLVSDASLLNRTFLRTGTIVDTWGRTNPRVAEYFRDELLSLSGQLFALRSLARESLTRTMVERIGKLRQKARRLERLAQAGSVLSSTGTFAVWEFCPWAYFHPEQTLPSPGESDTTLETSLCAGEYDSLALNVTNFSGETLQIRVWADAPSGNEMISWKDHLVFRRAVLVPTVRKETVADALPLLDEAGLLTVPPASTAQLWITFSAKGLKPDVYRTNIHLKSLEVVPTHRVIPFRIRVENLDLTESDLPRFCVWSYVTNEPDYVLDDLLDHNVNVLFGIAPSGECNAEGELVGSLDFTDHDRSVRRFADHAFLLFLSPQNRLRGQPFLSESWKRGFVSYLRRWVTHLRELGLGTDDFALYPYDEPSTPYSETTRNLVEIAKLVRKADPRILIYTDPTSGTEKKTLAMLQGLIDIWCPSEELLHRFGETIIPFAKENGKEVWMYDARGHSRTLSCLGIYRKRFWYAWNRGFTGVGWWVYKHGEHLWDGPNPSADYYSHVYESPTSIVTSKRWEAAREGVEDYKLLAFFEETIREASGSGKAPFRLIGEAEFLLGKLPAEMETALADVGDRMSLDPDSVPLYKLTTKKLARTRESLIAACLELRESYVTEK